MEMSARQAPGAACHGGGDALSPMQTWAVAAYVRSLEGSMWKTAASDDAQQQERMGMAIDMPGMAGMPIGGMMR